jgi:hypothetical protein
MRTRRAQPQLLLLLVNVLVKRLRMRPVGVRSKNAIDLL